VLLQNSSSESPLALTGASPMLLLTAGRSVKAPRVIQHAATRMPRGTETVGSGNGQALHELVSAGKTPHSREQPDSERSSVAGLDAVDSSGGSRRTAAEREAQLQELVPMTPVIVPGAAGDEPVMTWGQMQVLVDALHTCLLIRTVCCTMHALCQVLILLGFVPLQCARHLLQLRCITPAAAYTLLF
jgi:hypothetical protein